VNHVTTNKKKLINGFPPGQPGEPRYNKQKGTRLTAFLQVNPGEPSPYQSKIHVTHIMYMHLAGWTNVEVFTVLVSQNDCAYLGCKSQQNQPVNAQLTRPKFASTSLSEVVLSDAISNLLSLVF